MSNLLFLDLDGTIVDEVSGTIPSNVKLVLKKARESGNRLFVNTGRPLSSVTEDLRDPSIFDGVICGLGTHIFYHGKELLHYSIDKNECNRIVELAMNTNTEILFEGSECVYIKEQYRFPLFEDIRKGFTRLGHNLIPYPTASMRFDKLCLAKDCESDFETFMMGMSNYNVIDRGGNFYEVVPSGFSKDSGIDFICQYLGESLENCYAFGDSTNDLPMLMHVPHSIAMGNGSPEIFEKCEFVTSSMEKDGILNAFKHYGIIE